ncbi:hypothetical protein XENOCAPTIV_019529, partial [Xenoophorus captivus]
EPYELTRNSSALPSSIYSDTTLRGENVSLNFRTAQSPALLLYVSSYYREYMAVLINKHGGESCIFYLFRVLRTLILEEKCLHHFHHKMLVVPQLIF